MPGLHRCDLTASVCLTLQSSLMADLHADTFVDHLQPQDAYGLEKLASEELAMHYDKDFGIECRVARFHNIYGPYGTWKGGREKAPAAFCRKVWTSRLFYSRTGELQAILVLVWREWCCRQTGYWIKFFFCFCFSFCLFISIKGGTSVSVHALIGLYVLLFWPPGPQHACCAAPALPLVTVKLKVLVLTHFAILVQVLTSPKDIEMWGDGLQTRSFTFIDDCVEGILRITKSDYKEPLNLGSSEMVRYLPLVMALPVPV